MDKIRVLVVDDEKAFAINLVKIFTNRGFEAEAVFTGEQAIDQIKGGREFDVVVLDIMMPGMDGIETLKALKRKNPELEIIMLTGHATLESGAEAMRMGAYDYLMKPCDIEDLVEKIKEAYERERIRRRPVLWPRNKVGDCTLFSFKNLQPHDSLYKAVDVFYRKTYRKGAEAIYIQDAGGHFVGLITKRDLLRAAASSFQSFLRRLPVELSVAPAASSGTTFEFGRQVPSTPYSSSAASLTVGWPSRSTRQASLPGAGTGSRPSARMDPRSARMWIASSRRSSGRLWMPPLDASGNQKPSATRSRVAGPRSATS